jgi:hypothetical protein
MKQSFSQFLDCLGDCASSNGWGESPTAAPVAITASFSFTVSSSLTADQIKGSSTLVTAIKSAIAVMLELDVSSVTSVTVATAARKKLTPLDHRQAEEVVADWREEQAKDVSRVLGYGLELDLESGLVKNVADSHMLLTRKMAMSSVTITATISSSYANTAALTTAYTAYSSVFTNAFTVAAAASGYTYSSTDAPTLAPTTASTQITQNSRSRIIIGVCVGVGGFFLVAGAVYACYHYSSKSSANSKMPVESSAHAHTTGDVSSNGEIEVALALTHGDAGAVDAGADTWQHSGDHVTPHHSKA